MRGKIKSNRSGLKVKPSRKFRTSPYCQRRNTQWSELQLWPQYCTAPTFLFSETHPRLSQGLLQYILSLFQCDLM